MRAFLTSAAVMALLFGLEFPNPKLSGDPSPVPYDAMVVAANERVNEQAQTPAENAQAQTEDNTAESEKKADESDKMNTPGMQEDEEAKKPSQPPGAHPGNEN